jgi:hypothetical protein
MIGPLLHPFLWLAVTDPGALAKCPPRERYKQATLGGFVLSSAALAGIGAFGTTTEVGVPLAVALVAGMAIGILVMNFDRYVIASAKRQDTWWQTLLNVSPRLLFSVAAGQVVVIAVLISIFSSTIGSRVATDRQEALNAAQRLIDRQQAPLETLIDEREEAEADVTEVNHGQALEADPRYGSLSSRLQTVEKEAAAAQKAALCELDGTCGSGRAGAGPDYVAKRDRAAALNAEATSLKRQLKALAKSVTAEESASRKGRADYARSRIGELNRDIKHEQGRLDKQEAALVDVTRKYDGPLARWDALGEVAQEHPSMRTFKFWLWLALLLLDMSPALMKTLQLIGRMGPYEIAVEEADREAAEKLEAERRQGKLDRDRIGVDTERERQAKEQIKEYEAEKEVETAKHRIDLQAATDRATDELLDDGQRLRNRRDVEELDSWIEPWARKMNRRRYEEWIQSLEDRGESPWGDADEFHDTVNKMFGENGAGAPPPN